MPLDPHISRQGLAGIAAMLTAVAMSICASAAIPGGPQSTNEIVAKEKLIAQFYDAEQAYQEQLKVGRERYKQMQINRAKIIASMSAKLQARQQTVVNQPVAAPAANADEPARGFQPALAAAVLAAGLTGFCYYLYRPKPTSPAPVSPNRTPTIPVREHRGIDKTKPRSFALTPLDAEIRNRTPDVPVRNTRGVTRRYLLHPP